MKYSIRSLTIVLVILAFGAIGSYYYVYLYQEASHAEQPPVATTTDDTVDTSDWAVYENEEYGFRFRYPEEIAGQTFGVYEGAGDNSPDSIGNNIRNIEWGRMLSRGEIDHDAILFGVSVNAPLSGTTESHLERLLWFNPEVRIWTTIDDVPVVRVEQHKGISPNFYVVRQSYILIIFGGGPPDGSGLSTWAKGIYSDRELYDAILSTFEFI